MPSRKRPSEGLAEDGSSETPNKRARHLDTASGGDTFDEVDDDEDDEEMLDDPSSDDDEEVEQAPPGTQATNVAEHTQHMEHANQNIDRDRLFTRDELSAMDGGTEGGTPEAGIIESVSCFNFMCHENLKVKLGPQINFIIGHNGSGKSAVLTAISLCLGQSASSTNRGSKIKDFIKRGKDRAMVSVTLRNRGDDAYRHEAFGDSITVERHFNGQGVTTWKIKGENGRVVSNRRAELDELKDHLALQLDNPLNVLTQDKAREFLNASNSNDKYKHFLSGTQLKQLDVDYRCISENLDNMCRQRPAAARAFTEARRKFKMQMKKLETYKQKDKVLEMMKEIRSKLGWMQVEEVEQEIEHLDEQIEDRTREIERLKSNDESSSHKIMAMETEISETRERVQEAERLCQEHETNVAAAQEAWNARRTETQEIQVDERAIRSDIEEARTNINQLDREFQSEKKRVENIEGGAHLRILEDIEKQKEKYRGLEEELEHMRDDSSLREAVNSADKELDQAKSNVEEKKSLVDSSNRDVATLRRENPNPMHAFERNMPKLLQMIEKETRWGEMPVGPIGMHVVLRKPEWTSQIERAMTHALDSFIVSNSADRDLLAQIIKKCGLKKPRIIINRGDFDLKGLEPDVNLLTILRALEIKDKRIQNCLVITQKIEGLVLIKDPKEAQKFMFSDTEPKNVAATLAMHSGIRGGAMRFSKGSHGTMKTDQTPPWKGPSRLQADNATRIKMAQDRLADAQADLQDAMRQFREAETIRNRAIRQVENHKESINKLRKNLHVLQGEIMTKTEKYESSQPEEGKLNELQSLLNEAKQELAQKERQRQEIKSHMRDLQQTEEDAKADLAAEKRKARDLDNAKQELQNQVKDLEHTRQRMLRSMADVKDQVRVTETSIARIASRRAQLDDTRRDFERQAETISSRVAIGRNETKRSLEDKLEALDRQQRQFSSELGGSYVEVRKLALEYREAWQETKTYVRDIDLQVETLRSTVQTRRSRWVEFRRTLSNGTRSFFHYYMLERGFRGKMFFDHKKESLQLLVEPEDDNRQAGSGRQTQTLSGGEKSFTTVCMLLALWGALGSPIRCLDEYDVFMDQVNRDMSTKMLIAAARRAVSRQFVLITPQSMNNVDVRNDVRIIKMTDPERGQRTLNRENFVQS